MLSFMLSYACFSVSLSLYLCDTLKVETISNDPYSSILEPPTGSTDVVAHNAQFESLNGDSVSHKTYFLFPFQAPYIMHIDPDSQCIEI